MPVGPHLPRAKPQPSQPEEIALNRKGRSGDRKADAAIHFAAKVAETRGQVGDPTSAAMRTAVYTDAQIVEIVGLVVENVFTNFVNKVADTDIDFWLSTQPTQREHPVAGGLP